MIHFSTSMWLIIFKIYGKIRIKGNFPISAERLDDTQCNISIDCVNSKYFISKELMLKGICYGQS